MSSWSECQQRPEDSLLAANSQPEDPLARLGWVSSLLSTGLRAELVEGTRLLELKAVEGMGEVPTVPAEQGSRLALYPERCLDYTPAVVGPHPLWRPYFAN